VIELDLDEALGRPRCPSCRSARIRPVDIQGGKRLLFDCPTRHCGWRAQAPLPTIRKKIIYLDTSTVSHIARALLRNDTPSPWIGLYDTLRRAAAEEVISCPASPSVEAEADLSQLSGQIREVARELCDPGMKTELGVQQSSGDSLLESCARGAARGRSRGGLRQGSGQASAQPTDCACMPARPTGSYPCPSVASVVAFCAACSLVRLCGLCVRSSLYGVTPSGLRDRREWRGGKATAHPPGKGEDRLQAAAPCLHAIRDRRRGRRAAESDLLFVAGSDRIAARVNCWLGNIV